MEKFGLLNVLQTPYSLPETAGFQNDLSLGEKLSATFQAAENIASLFRGAPDGNDPSKTPSAATMEKTQPSPPATTNDRATSESAPINETEFKENGRIQNAQSEESILPRKAISQETYARFIQKQEEISKKIGGGK